MPNALISLQSLSNAAFLTYFACYPLYLQILLCCFITKISSGMVILTVYSQVFSSQFKKNVHEIINLSHQTLEKKLHFGIRYLLMTLIFALAACHS